jgi:hypothetical protein
MYHSPAQLYIFTFHTHAAGFRGQDSSEQCALTNCGAAVRAARQGRASIMALYGRNCQKEFRSFLVLSLRGRGLPVLRCRQSASAKVAAAADRERESPIYEYMMTFFHQCEYLATALRNVTNYFSASDICFAASSSQRGSLFCICCRTNRKFNQL